MEVASRHLDVGLENSEEKSWPEMFGSSHCQPACTTDYIAAPGESVHGSGGQSHP